MVRYFPFKIKTIQTDNGFEFTNRLSWNGFEENKKTLFEETLEKLGIDYQTIKPHTPKQNGRVERSHRKDQERFYYKRIFYSLEDLRNQGKEWRKEYNNFPMRPLGWLSPREFIPVKISTGRMVSTIRPGYRTAYALVRYVASRQFAKNVSSSIDTHSEKSIVKVILEKIKDFFYS